MAQSTTRNACAGAITAMYAGTALWAYYDRDRAFWTFAFVAGSIALPFVVAQLLKRVVYGLVIGAVLTAISIAFPPVAVVAALIGTLMLCAKFVRFARTLPFLLTGSAAYGFLWFVPALLARRLAAPGDDRILLLAGVAVAGVLLIGLLAVVMEYFDSAPARTVLFSIGYGWYLLFFLLTFLIPDADDVDSDD